jgi:hypothetical protein
MDRLAQIEKLAGKRGKVSDWFARGLERIPEDTSDKDRLNEMAAYAIEEYENDSDTLPQTIARWVQDFLAAIRAFIFEKTGHLPDKLTAADLSAIAQRFLRSATLRENLIVGASPAEVMASQGDDGKTPWRRARDWALSKLRQDYSKEKTVLSKDGDEIIVAFSGFDHALNQGVPTLEKTAMALHIEEAIRSAQRGKTIPDRKGRKDPYATTAYNTDATIDGDSYDVKILVRHHQDGSRYYDHFVMTRKSPPGRWGRSETDTASSPIPPSNSGLSLSIEEIGIPINGNIRFSVAAKTKRTAPPSPWQKSKSKVSELMSSNVVDSLIYNYQDKHIDLKRLQENIRKLDGEISDASNAYPAALRAWCEKPTIPGYPERKSGRGTCRKASGKRCFELAEQHDVRVI